MSDDAWKFRSSCWPTAARLFAVISGILIGITFSAFAQTENPFENPKNLQVLPKNISADELHEVMEWFSQSTGLECDSCHVIEDGAPYPERDDLPQKRIARHMWQMTEGINKSLEEVDLLAERGIPPVKVTCMTCHRGVARPEMIQDILDIYKGEKDADGAATHYRRLREIYYGSHSYDFAPLALGIYAMKRSKEGMHDFAIALHELNLEFHPDDAEANVLMGISRMEMGDYDNAIIALRRAVELAPDMEFFKKLLSQAESARDTQAKDE